MFTRPLAVVALAFVGLACGGSSSTTPSQDGGTKNDGTAGDSSSGLTNAQACMDRATAQCALVAQCSIYDLQIRYGTQDACVSGVTQNCINSLEAPSNGNNATLTEACAKAYPTWSCQDFEDNVNPPTACVQKSGTQAAGAACAFPGQCQSAFCAIPPTAACGTCAPLPTAGTSCAELTNCGSGLICDAKSSTCVAYGAMGASCGATAPCGFELSCVGASAKKGTMGTCQAAVLTVGGTCDATQATGPGCATSQGLTCNSMTKQCEKATFSAGGGACGVVDDQDAYCSAGGTCSAAAGMAGTCTAAAATGGSCGGTNGGCVTPERCIGGSGDSGSGGTCQVGSASTCK
jgi:hypothetical protein